MDCDKKYIKMCEKAWPILNIPDYIPTLGRYIKDKQYEVDEFGYYWYRSEFTDRVPLYRQDQLQEMVEEIKDKNHFIFRFYNFLQNKYVAWAHQNAYIVLYNTFNGISLEKLWLVFVMKELYSQTWDEEKVEWV